MQININFVIGTIFSPQYITVVHVRIIFINQQYIDGVQTFINTCSVYMRCFKYQLCKYLTIRRVRIFHYLYRGGIADATKFYKMTSLRQIYLDRHWINFQLQLKNFVIFSSTLLIILRNLTYISIGPTIIPWQQI